MNVKNKKISILGLGESGLTAALFLAGRGADVFVSEGQATDAIRARCVKLDARGVPYEVGMHSIDRIESSDFVVVSPGIGPQTNIYQALCKLHVDMISEVELASRFCDNDIIAVTGTDGKTTVTTLITDILNNCGMPAVSCGNIGNSFIGEIDNLQPGTKVVVEVSSFQLYGIKRFRPKVAVLTNIAPDHLNWHYNFADYIHAKQKVFQNQTGVDYAILNFSDEETNAFLCRIKAKKLFFNQFETDFDPNQDAALKICDVYDLDKEKACETLRNFRGVEHRLEQVSSHDDICYINDSKATSIHALEWALDRQQKKVILLCGGRNKGLDFTTVREKVSEKVHHAVCFGESREEIMGAWKDSTALSSCETIDEALEAARAMAKKGDVVLLSPACTSFDQFSSYTQRGTYFKSLVAKPFVSNS